MQDKNIKDARQGCKTTHTQRSCWCMTYGRHTSTRCKTEGFQEQGKNVRLVLEAIRVKFQAKGKESARSRCQKAVHTRCKKKERQRRKTRHWTQRCKSKCKSKAPDIGFYKLQTCKDKNSQDIGFSARERCIAYETCRKRRYMIHCKVYDWSITELRCKT